MRKLFILMVSVLAFFVITYAWNNTSIQGCSQKVSQSHVSVVPTSLGKVKSLYR